MFTVMYSFQKNFQSLYFDVCNLNNNTKAYTIIVEVG